MFMVGVLHKAHFLIGERSLKVLSRDVRGSIGQAKTINLQTQREIEIEVNSQTSETKPSDDHDLIAAADGLVFDCDGTLADTMPLHYIAWRDTLKRNDVEFSEDRFYAMAGQPTVHIVRVLLEEQGVSGDPKTIAVEKEAAFLNVLPQVEPIEPIVSIARKYRETKKMGVGSGSNHAVVLQVLEHIGLTDFFDAIVGAEATERHKPEPDVFLEVARQIGVEPTKCRVYEDADLGIEAAHRAGMTCFDIRQIHTPRRITG